MRRVGPFVAEVAGFSACAVLSWLFALGACRLLQQLGGGLSGAGWVNLVANLVGLGSALGSLYWIASGGAAYRFGVRPLLEAAGLKPLREVMKRGPKRPTELEHGRPPRPEAWEGPDAYLVPRPELRDEIVGFVEQAEDGGLCLVIGDWGTGKTVVACEAGHHLLSRRRRWAVYHAHVDRLADPDKAHEAVDGLSEWLARWPVRWSCRRTPILVVEDLHRNLAVAGAIVPRLVRDAGAVVVATTRSERKGPGGEGHGARGVDGADQDVLCLPSGKEVPLPLELCRLATDQSRCRPVELTRKMYDDMAPKVIAKLRGPAKLSEYADREREEWSRLSQCSLLFVAAMARAARGSREHLAPDEVFKAALDELGAVLGELDPDGQGHARARLVTACALVYGPEETPVHEDFLVDVSGAEATVARGRLEELAKTGRLVRWPSEDRKYWYGLAHAGVAELIWRLVASRDGQTDSLLTDLRETLRNAPHLGPAVRRAYLGWLEDDPRTEIREWVREGLAVRLAPWLDEDGRARMVSLPLGRAMEALRGGERAVAACLLSWLRDPADVDALVGVLRDEDSDVRREAASALGWIGGSVALGALIGLLSDGDSEVCWQAAYGLGQIGDARALPALGGRLSGESDTWVRSGLEWAIEEIWRKQEAER